MNVKLGTSEILTRLEGGAESATATETGTLTWLEKIATLLPVRI